jgi:hypothetical protein
MAEISLTTLTPVGTIRGYRRTAAAARQTLRADLRPLDLPEDRWRERQRLIVLLGELETWLGELEREHGEWLVPRTA